MILTERASADLFFDSVSPIYMYKIHAELQIVEENKSSSLKMHMSTQIQGI
jgi:hypothetical protein